MITDITAIKKAELDLKKRLADSEVYSKATVDREMKMIELKREVDELLKKAGKLPKYGKI